jgi:hypothetical protein
MSAAPKLLAYHFTGPKLCDGRPVPADGVTLRHPGKPKLCRSGLHASLQPFDALQFAPGDTLCLVECGGMVVHGHDKLVCTERTIIARMDATPLLRYYARMQALSVVHLLDAPSGVVLDYLMTGDESLRAVAWAVAWAAASYAASAAMAAASDAASDAASAARAVAWAVAWAAARAAASAASAARAAASDAARAAASAASAASAARAAASDAASAASDAASAASDAARADFNALVNDAFQDHLASA